MKRLVIAVIFFAATCLFVNAQSMRNVYVDKKTSNGTTKIIFDNTNSTSATVKYKVKTVWRNSNETTDEGSVTLSAREKMEMVSWTQNGQILNVIYTFVSVTTN